MFTFQLYIFNTITMIKILRLNLPRKKSTCFFQNHNLKHAYLSSVTENRTSKEKKRRKMKKHKLKCAYHYESDSDASDSPVNKRSTLPAKDIDVSQHNVSNIQNEELLTEEEKSTDELNIDIMIYLKTTCQNLKSSSVFSLFRNNQYAVDGTYFADTAWTVLPEIVTINLNTVEEAYCTRFNFGRVIQMGNKSSEM